MVALAAKLRRDVAQLRELARGRSRTATAALSALRADPAAALDLAGLDRQPWQVDFLRSGAAQVLLNCCRQSGKSTACALRAVVELLTVPGALVLLLSPSLRQSGELFLKCVDAYDRLGRPVPELRRTATVLEVLGGGRLVSLPGKPSSIRGFSRPKLVVIDESAFVDDALFIAARPMLARSRGKLALASTPYGQRGEFYRAFTRGGAGWQRFRVTADDVPAITPEFLEQERLDLGQRWYGQEYFCDFAACLENVFDPAAVEAALEANVRPLFLGDAA